MLAEPSWRRSHATDLDELALHRRLTTFNRVRLEPALEPVELDLAVEAGLRELERLFIERERAIVHGAAAQAPVGSRDFVAWFEALEATGAGQHDPLFEYLAERATRDEMIWFLNQELAGEAGFDDLVALTQVKFPLRPKLELARNYWDELGRGHASGVHGELLGNLADALAIAPCDEVVWEALALGNLMVALAINRHHAYRSIGALGAIELTAPGRTALVNEGLRRLGVPGEARRYYALHATLDVKHSQAWNREVIAPLVASDPRIGTAIAEGALMRLNAGARCFERYRSELGLELQRPQARDPSPAAA